MNITLNMKGAGFSCLETRDGAKKVNKIVAKDGRVYSVEFADFVCVPNFGNIALYYYFDNTQKNKQNVKTKEKVCAVNPETRQMSRFLKITGDNVFSIHRQAIRQVCR